MCANKHSYQVGNEYSYRQSKHCGGMSWLPFALLLFFVFGPHIGGFALHPWMWFLLPGVVVIGSSFLTKAAHAGTETQESLCTQPDKHVSSRLPMQETYQEGGQHFQYPVQQTQQAYDEEPQAYYLQEMPPME